MKRLSVSAFKERIQIRSANTRSCAQLVCEVMCDAKTVFFPGALCLVDNVPVILRGRWADFNWQVQAKKAFICQQNNCLARHRCDVPMTRCARYNTQMLKRCSWGCRGGGMLFGVISVCSYCRLLLLSPKLCISVEPPIMSAVLQIKEKLSPSSPPPKQLCMLI